MSSAQDSTWKDSNPEADRLDANAGTPPHPSLADIGSTQESVLELPDTPSFIQDSFGSIDPARSAIGVDSAATTLRRPGGGLLSTAADLLDVSDNSEALSRGLSGQSFVPRRHLADGGFGEVWEAEQPSLGRLVAIKRVRMDHWLVSRKHPDRSKAMQRLFEQEARIAGHLEHPNIIPIHDLAVSPDGRPMMAMKLLRGRSWDKQIAEDFPKLTLDDFLDIHLPILVNVAQAVAFAHARGIVHRDLKPTQVMVGDFGEVLLLDWGLAIVHDIERLRSGAGGAGGDAIDSSSMTTAITSPAGTPAFMAPEQTMATADRVGPWTDVYLLGGILYYLLTGTPPHLATTGEAAMMVAREGKIERPIKRAPNRVPPRELERLCLKSLMPIPEDRLQTADEFLSALKDYLGGASRRREALELTTEADARLRSAQGDYKTLAESASMVARARGLWPGHPDAARLADRLAEAHALAALEAGDLRLAEVQAYAIDEHGPFASNRIDLLACVAAAREAKEAAVRQRRLYRTAMIALGAMLVLGGVFHIYRQWQARAEMEKINAIVRRQRDSAEDMMTFLLGDFINKLEGVGRLDLIRDVSSRLAEYLATVNEVLPGDAKSALARARAYLYLSSVYMRQDALEQAKRSLDLAAQFLSETRQSPMLGSEPWKQDREVSNLRLKALVEAGDHSAALALAESEVESVDKEMPADVPETTQQVMRAEADANLAWCLYQVGRVEESEALFIKAEAGFESLLQRGESEPQMLDSYVMTLKLRSAVAEYRGNFDTAEKIYVKMAGFLDDLLAKDPINLPLIESLAEALAGHGGVLRELGRVTEARDQFTKARELFDRLVTIDPTNASWRDSRARHVVQLAELIEGEEGVLAAIKVMDEGIADFDAIARREPDAPSHVINMASGRGKRGKMRMRAGDLAGMMQDFEEAGKIMEILAEKHPDNPAVRMNLASSLNQLGEAKFNAGDARAGSVQFERSIAILEKLVEDVPHEVSNKQLLATTRIKWSMLLHDLNLKQDELKQLLAARATLDGIALEGFDGTAAKRERAAVLLRLSQTYTLLGQYDDAEDSIRGAVELYGALKANDPKDGGVAREWVMSRQQEAVVMRRKDKNADLMPLTNEIEALLREWKRRDPNGLIWDSELARIENLRSVSQADRGELDAADQSVQRAIAIARELTEKTPGQTGGRLMEAQFQVSLATVRIKMGDSDEQLKPIGERILFLLDESVVGSNNAPRFRQPIAWGLHLAGRHAEARETLDALLGEGIVDPMLEKLDGRLKEREGAS